MQWRLIHHLLYDLYYVSYNLVDEALFTAYSTVLQYINSFYRRSHCRETSVIKVLCIYYMNLMVFSLVWSDNSLVDERDVVIANLKVFFTKEHVLYVVLDHRALATHSCHSRSHRAAVVPSAAVVRSGFHTRVMLKPTQCLLLRLYRPRPDGFSISRKLTPAAAGPCGCSATHPTAERRLRLTSTLPSMSSRTVFYSVGLLLDSAFSNHSITIHWDYSWLRSKNCDTWYMRLTGCNVTRDAPTGIILNCSSP
jgi:hypothetical protein